MKTRKIALTTLALASLGLGGVVLSPVLLTAAQAQDPNGPPPPQQGGGQGGFGGGFGGGQGGGRGGRGGGGGGGVRGAVTAVDPTAKTITITTQQGGSQTITVGDTAQIVSQTTATVADLKTGDQIQVQGVPTALTASTLTIGENPLTAGLGGGRGGAGAAGAGGPGGFGGGAAGAGGRGGFGGGGGFGGAQGGATQETGTVTATSPLTISLTPTTSLILKLAADAKVTKYTPVDIASIKAGDQITVRGQADANGNYTATVVGVNLQMGGPGGFGGGGFGGRGGGAGGGGGFGGGQGGGGQQGGQDPNALPPAQIGGPVDNG